LAELDAQWVEPFKRTMISSHDCGTDRTRVHLADDPQALRFDWPHVPARKALRRCCAQERSGLLLTRTPSRTGWGRTMIRTFALNGPARGHQISF